jgi:prolyl-tRNA synthetase
MGFGRTLAATISHHGDNHGLVLPPKVAPKQVVIIPILFRGKESATLKHASKVETMLHEAGIRVALDDDDRFTPGDKYYKWEMLGVPLRIEIGPKEANSETVTLVRRDNFEKIKVDLCELLSSVENLFDEIFENLRMNSYAMLESLLMNAYNMEELQNYMEERKIVRVNWCGDPSCAFNIKDLVAGEVRGIRWDKEEEPTDACIMCGDESQYIAYVSRTY